jgi:hypothetical protein
MSLSHIVIKKIDPGMAWQWIQLDALFSNALAIMKQPVMAGAYCVPLFITG